MKPAEGFELPEDKAQANRRAMRLEWWTIFFLLTIVTVMYFAMGSSQTMKAAWLEDLLSLVPPIAILVASRFRTREPNEKFPYGYHRAVSIAFLCASAGLFAMGALMLYDAASALVKLERPSIGVVEVFGQPVWQGWVMIAALIYSAIPPVILGRMKLPLAREIHDKALHADADMNKADWLTAVAGVVGITGIAIGWWWADSVAAGFISFEVLKDGYRNLRRVVEDLMDSRPTTVDGEVDVTQDRLLENVLALDWVESAFVRLREDGHVLIGEIFVVPKRDTDDLAEKAVAMTELARSLDWRLHDIVTMPVDRIDWDT